MPFQDRFQIISLLAQPLCFSFSWSISTTHGGVSHRLSQHRRPRKRFLLKSWSTLLKIHGSSFMPSPYLFRSWEILFIHPEYVGSCFPFLFTEGHRSRKILRSHISATVIQLSWWFSLFHQSFSNSYGGSFRFFFLCYHINSFVLSIYRWFMKTFSSLRHVTSQSFSGRISNMQNPLFLINLIGGG